MRPTGRLHLGHLLGALPNWVRLQDDYDCFYCVADLHALTTRYDSVAGMKADGLEMVADWIAAGIDPERSVIFRQSEAGNSPLSPSGLVAGVSARNIAV